MKPSGVVDLVVASRWSQAIHVNSVEILQSA
jgi:hypothetical protein